MFYFDEINGKKIMKSDMLDGLQHFFTTRESVIKSKETGMEETIYLNKQDICSFLDIETKNLISPVQTHSENVNIAEEEITDYPETDALILANFEQAVFLNFADCTPVILYDKVLNIGAIAHAGWRGTASKIAQKTLTKMKEEFGSNAEDITAVIGPAISMCCYNVGDEVLKQLSGTVNDFAGLSKSDNGGIYVDLKAINKKQLEEAGVKEIDVCPYCTCCDNDIFFSYRKENGTTNRHSAVIRLI